MAADGTPFQLASAVASAIDDAMATVPAYDAVEDLAHRGAGKKDLARREEADPARGWSSAVVERGLALRRRGGSAASCSLPCGGGLVVGEGARRREEANASAALGVGALAAAAEEPLVDPGVAFFCLAVL